MPGRAKIRSRRGELEADVFIPMHYDEVNRLTLSSFDPHSRQPSYKFCAVTVEQVGRPT